MNNLQSDLNLKNPTSLSVADLTREAENAQARVEMARGDLKLAVRMRMARMITVRDLELTSAIEYRREIVRALRAAKKAGQ